MREEQSLLFLQGCQMDKTNPFLVFKIVRPVSVLMTTPGVIVTFSYSRWMNEELLLDWVK